MLLWEGIDPVEAAARLRALNRRLGELDEAYKNGQSLLASRPGSFAAELSLKSLRQMQERLQDERVELVKHRLNERITVALNGSQFADHSASLGRLGIFLIRLQKLYSSIAQAITTGPRQRGPLSREILHNTDLRFADVFPSSFGMELFVKSGFDMFGDSIAVSSLQTLFNLLNATNREQEIARLSAELGQRSVAHLRHVLTDMATSDAGIKLNWVDSGGTEYGWAANKEQISHLRQNVSRFQQRQASEQIVQGVLIGASLLRDRFELMATSNEIVEGKVTRSAKPKLREFFGRTCLVTLDQVDLVENLTGEVKKFFTMTDIRATDLPAQI